MTRDQFDRLIRRIERISRKNPRRFILRTASLVYLAYGYLSLVLLLSLAGCLGIIFLICWLPNVATIKLGLVGLVVCGGLFWMVLRGLWVRLEAPQGHAVTREVAPELFRMLDELRAALQCKPFHTVLLVAEHNAAVVQVPRLGVFGWHHNYLLLGLPLMQSLAPDEFKAVLAHEFAHSSQGHGRYGNWLYRVRQSWEQIFEHMEKHQISGGFVLGPFIKWFWPLFNAHAFVLARANEYEADAGAVRIAGVDAAANALLRLPVDSALLEEKFWPNIYARANTQKEPPGDVMLLQANALKSGAKPEESARWLRQAFLAETNNSDTHPCLKDRLRAMGHLPADTTNSALPSSPLVPPRAAAEVFLGAYAETALRVISEEWRKAVIKAWLERHERTLKLNEELAITTKPTSATPSVEALWKKATALIELHDDTAALPVVEQILAFDSHHAGANLIRGRLFLEKDEPAGVPLIETAMREDDLLTIDGCDLLYGYYTRTGQRDQLRPLEERADRFQQRYEEAQYERANISAHDRFIPHELDPQQLTGLQKIMSEEPEIALAAVARKEVKWHPKNPCYVIALRVRTKFWKFRSPRANQKLVERIVAQVQLPGNFLVFVDEQNLKPLGKKVFGTRRASFYKRAN